MLFVFLGIQGSGKGTQAKLLSQKLGLEHINLGEYFRRQIAENNPLGILAHEYLSKGHLVPDEIVCELVSKLMIKINKGFVFDGFPRTLSQAEYLHYITPVERVFYLELDDGIAKERMLARRVCSFCRKDYNLLINPPKESDICDKCGNIIVKRADDTIELIQNRLELFHNETHPLTEFYRSLDLLTVIKANADINEIHQQILSYASKT